MLHTGPRGKNQWRHPPQSGCGLDERWGRAVRWWVCDFFIYHSDSRSEYFI